MYNHQAQPKSLPIVIIATLKKHRFQTNKQSSGGAYRLLNDANTNIISSGGATCANQLIRKKYTLTSFENIPSLTVIFLSQTQFIDYKQYNQFSSP